MARPARPEVLAFLADVKDNPDDATPWLVLTDWLEEHGGEADRARAEYCRLCFDKLGKKTYASDWEKGERRRELFRDYKEAWLGPIVEMNFQVQKGLLVIGLPDHFLRLRARLLEDREAWAWVSSLQLSARVEELLDPDTQTLLAGLTHLDVWTESPEAGLVRLARCPALSRLRGLRVRVRRVSVEMAEAVVASPCLARLEKLTILTPYNYGGRSAARVPDEARKVLEARFGAGLVCS